MLMKSKAWGDVEDVNTKDPSNRMYFIVEFAETGTKKIVYFSKKCRVRDMLHKLGRKFTSLAFAAPTIPSDLSLVCFNDSFGWEDERWDRLIALPNCIAEFETLKISTMSTVDAAACQSRIEEKRNVDDTVFHSLSASSSSDHSYGKGNKVWYLCDTESDEKKESTIIGVHYDDYPNVYYTILLNDGVEKQTIASRLIPLHENEKESKQRR